MGKPLPKFRIDLVRPGEHVSPQSGHLAGSGSRTSMANCVMQPRHSPATVSRRSRRRRLQMRTQQRAAAHVSTARRTASSVPPPTPASRGCRRRPVPLPLDRHRPAAYHSPRFARSRPGARSEGHEIAQSDSFRTGLQGESLPICSGSAISTNAHAGDRCQWPSPPSAVPPATPASKPPDGPFTHIRRAARDAGQQTARRAVHPPSPRGLPPRRSRRHSRPPLTGPGLTADECGRHPRHLHAAAAQRRSSGR